ncbi:hypothetical protein L0Z72_14770 [candidate division KSB1 bacterium]|nr:hypothetical protein [candidate division KSB1 bacterium]
MSDSFQIERPKELEEKLSPEGFDELDEILKIFGARYRKKFYAQQVYQSSYADENLPQNIIRDVESEEIPSYKTKVLRQKLGKAAFKEMLVYLNMLFFNNPEEIRHEEVPDSEYGN